MCLLSSGWLSWFWLGWQVQQLPPLDHLPPCSFGDQAHHQLLVSSLDHWWDRGCQAMSPSGREMLEISWTDCLPSDLPTTMWQAQICTQGGKARLLFITPVWKQVYKDLVQVTDDLFHSHSESALPKFIAHPELPDRLSASFEKRKSAFAMNLTWLSRIQQSLPSFHIWF